MRRNIVYYVTRQYMKRNKKRTAVTFLGIMLMVLLMTCIFVGKDTGIGYLEQASYLRILELPCLTSREIRKDHI